MEKIGTVFNSTQRLTVHSVTANRERNGNKV